MNNESPREISDQNSMADAITMANTTIPVSEYHHMLKSKCDSPFLMRKLPRVGVGDSNCRGRPQAIQMKYNLPHISAAGYDSGVSSLSSAQMFFADISEFWPSGSKTKSSNRRIRRNTASSSSISLSHSTSTQQPTTTTSFNSLAYNFFTNKLGLIK